MTEVKREHRQAAVFAMGIEGWSLDGVAAAIAEAEQRGAERERADVVYELRKVFHLYDAAKHIESGKHLEDEE